MAHTRKAGTAGRFGSRYGRKVRYNVRTVEKQAKGTQECPNCGKPKIKRVAVGIYECKACKARVAGKAYTVK